MVNESNCIACDGRGYLADGKIECQRCHGKGSEPDYETMLVASERQVLRQAETIRKLSKRMKRAAELFQNPDGFWSESDVSEMNDLLDPDAA